MIGSTLYLYMYIYRDGYRPDWPGNPTDPARFNSDPSRLGPSRMYAVQ